MMFDKVKLEAIAKTYLRAAAAAVAAIYLADPNQAVKKNVVAGLAADAGPVLKALDSKSTDCGRGSK